MRNPFSTESKAKQKLSHRQKKKLAKAKAKCNWNRKEGAGAVDYFIATNREKVAGKTLHSLQKRKKNKEKLQATIGKMAC